MSELGILIGSKKTSLHCEKMCNMACYSGGLGKVVIGANIVWAV